MTAPAWRSAGTAAVSATQSASLTPGLPAGWSSNDIFMLHAAGFGTKSLTLPGGWTEVTGSPAIEANSGNWSAYYWKRATGSESAPLVSSGSTNMFIAQVFAVSGAITTGTPVETLVYTNNTAGGTSLSAPSITTSGGDELVLVHVYGLQFSGSATTISAWTNAGLTGVTERNDANYQGAFINIAVATGAKTAAGATGATTATWSASLTEWVAVTHAFKSNSLNNVSSSDVTPAAADTAVVSATIVGADTGSGVDSGVQTTTAGVGETGTGLDTASIRFGDGDTGSFAESTKVVANGATLAFGTDAGAATEAAIVRVLDSDIVSTLEVAYVGYQGALPSGPRVVRVMATTNIVDEV